ncbi:MAG: Ppx/GppA family phosphatase, partial [Pseudomonadota bacterium]
MTPDHTLPDDAVPDDTLADDTSTGPLNPRAPRLAGQISADGGAARRVKPTSGFPKSDPADDDIGARTPLYGALDLGTNNCRLLVARPSRRGFVVVDSFSRIIRLGEGLTTSGRLSDAAMARTIQALRICAGKLRKHNVARKRLVATQACRMAENGETFIKTVKRETGLDLEVLSQESE